ncbi:MAG: hypothetical protein IJ524_01535 [Bacteroidales bacterium]|nr:hypothetical protein [Bacteroidales bacterium]
MHRHTHILFTALAALLLLGACGKNTIAEEEHLLAGDQWNRFTPEHFDIAVGNIENYYNIDLTAAIDTSRFRYSELPVMLILKSPGGEERQFYGAIVFKGKSEDAGHPVRWRGEMVDGYRVATGRIRSYFSFNHKGVHTLDVSQATSQYDLEGVHSIALTVSKAKVDYDF